MHAPAWQQLLDPLGLDFLYRARTGHLATVGPGGFPSVVPVCFALRDDPAPMLVSVLDDKPKQVPDADLGRVRNIRRHPQVCLTVDRYEEDWTRLAYIQVRGIARIIAPEETTHATSLEVLRAKYAQYQAMDLTNRAVIALTEPRIRVWRASNSAE